MKIGRIQAGDEAHLAIVARAGEEDGCLDLTKLARRHGRRELFETMRAFIAGGERALVAARELAELAGNNGEDEAFTELGRTKWLVPVETPANFLCAGRNFGSHHKESAEGWDKEGIKIDRSTFPTGFSKLPGTLAGNGERVPRPAVVEELDYEIEVAAVLGRSALNVSEAEAQDSVFGYTVFLDISARDWQRAEMRNQMLMLGKNFPKFGPLGPWILTADEVPDPSQLKLELRVNGELRQDGPASDMIFDFAQLISFWSKVGLQPGDLIASGTPEGVAMHHKGESWYLEPGDRVVGTVPQIGALEVTIA